MKTTLTKGINNQSGSALVMVMLALLGVTALSIMAIQTGTMEMDVATNDKFHQVVFFAADGANEMVTELVEQNIEERGFPGPTWGKVGISTLAFFNNAPDEIVPTNNVPGTGPGEYDIKLPNFGDTNVFLKVYGLTGGIPGGSIVIAAGYEGMAKSNAGGGAGTNFDIRSLAIGPYNSSSRIWLGWRHLI